MYDSPATSLHKLIFAMDKSADVLLQSNCGLSYNRAYFLLALFRVGAVSQVRLASELGYSRASVSTMAHELTSLGYMSIDSDPHNNRRQILSLTVKGERTAIKGITLLDRKFNEVMRRADVDADLYNDLTKKIYGALLIKGE